MLPYFSEKFGNAASKTHALGWVAEAAVEKAREQVAALIGATSHEIIFTSGATESINLALKGLFRSGQMEGEIVTVSTEHKAVLDTCASLSEQGVKVHVVPVDREGRIGPDQIRKVMSSKTRVVSVMMANNETGVIHPVHEIGKVVREFSGCYFMTDATQAAGKIRIDVNQDQIDILTLSAHKMYGPKGAGALFIRRKDPRVSLQPLLHGGGHERGLRSGTLNVPAIVGLGWAAEIAGKEYWDDAQRLSELRTLLEQALEKRTGARINGEVRNRLSNVSNIRWEGLKADELIKALPSIAVSTGSACTSAIPAPSHVLKAMGLTDAEAYSSVRFSLGRRTTREEILTAMEQVEKAVQTLVKK